MEPPVGARDVGISGNSYFTSELFLGRQSFILRCIKYLEVLA